MVPRGRDLRREGNTPTSTGRMIAYLAGAEIACLNLGAAERSIRTTKTLHLTKRHREVVRLVSLGCTVPEAAAILKLSPSTVDNHKMEAMARLGTNKLALVTRLALKLGISSLKDRLPWPRSAAAAEGKTAGTERVSLGIVAGDVGICSRAARRRP
jgi:DNA-binding CsgD family transcriptional regulator